MTVPTTGAASIDFDKDGSGLVPAIAQDAASGRVLMLAWMNREALAETLSTGFATFYSRSRKSLWRKGETSGNRLKVVSVSTDCDKDAILMSVAPEGPACHTGAESCFFEPMTADAPGTTFEVLARIEKTLESRRVAPPAGSYVAKLYADANKRHKKVGEEATELVVASLSGSKDEIAGEAADVLFHMLVLLRSHGLGLADVARVLASREGAPRRE